jgi:hypothetical protein
MSLPADLLTLTIPLTAENRRQAERFAQIQVTPEASERIFRHTLAILATAHYLKMMDIDTDLMASYSWNPAIQMVADIADLYLPDLRHRIECRPVRPGDPQCYFPEEVWDNRLGFVVVQIDAAATTAELLGFVPEISVEQLPLSYLRPLENLVDVIDIAEAKSTAAMAPAMASIQQLRDWLQGAGSELWQSLNQLAPPTATQLEPTFRMHAGLRAERLVQRINELYANQSGPETERAVMPANLGRRGMDETAALDALIHLIGTTADESVRFQAAELLWTLAPDHPGAGAQRVLDLGLYLAGHALALLVAVLPKSTGQVSVLARVYPLQETYLPPDLQLIGLDENNTNFFTVQSRRQDNYIQFHFIADPGDRFSLQVSIGASRFAENFSV